MQLGFNLFKDLQKQQGERLDDFERVVRRQQHELKLKVEDIKRLQTDADGIQKAAIQQLEDLDRTRGTKEDVDSITARMDAFASIEHIHALKTIFLPKVQAFSDQIDFYEKDNA